MPGTRPTTRWPPDTGGGPVRGRRTGPSRPSARRAADVTRERGEALVPLARRPGRARRSRRAAVPGRGGRRVFLPSRVPWTSPACASVARCFATAWRVIGQLAGELRRRGRAEIGQALDEVAAARVGERPEDRSYAVAHAALAWSSSATPHSGGLTDVHARPVADGRGARARRCRRPPSAARAARAASTVSTTARRTSPLSQWNTPSPPGVGSSSTSFANHSSSCSGSRQRLPRLLSRHREHDLPLDLHAQPPSCV